MTTTKTETELRHDKGISMLGTYLLQGWVMTDIVCPVTGCSLPMMRTKDRSKQICVLCDDPDCPYPPPNTPENMEIASPHASHLTKEEEEELDMMMEESTAKASSDLPEEVQKRREQGERASKLLGQKMLAGWTLLDEECPNASCYGIPLMRNRQKQKYCVICERYYSEGQDRVTSSVGRASTPVPVRNASREDASRRNHERLIHGPSPISVPEKTLRTNDQLPDTSKRRKMDVSDVSTSEQAAMTIATLTKHMEGLRATLDSAQNPNDSRLICDAIASCAGAIVACQGIQP